jgi:GT2 family glycosyltransferase
MQNINKKIGVGIITCNRPQFFKECYASLPDYINEIVVVNDGEERLSNLPRGTIIQGPSGKQVGRCKNIAMQHLLDQGCDYIFTLEDDIKIKDPMTFLHYITACMETNIQHFNFGFSQKENLDSNLKPIIKKIIDYKTCKLVLTPNVLGALTFYTREALQTIGLHHYLFNKGHGDHPELTYRAWKHGFTTPFWWFADIYNSWEMIENLSNLGSDSIVRNQTNMWENFKEACETFKLLHGVSMLDVPHVPEHEVIQLLKQLKTSSR